MGKKLGNIVLALVFVAGFCILMYPIFSDWYNSQHQAQSVATYKETVQEMDTTEIDKIFKDAKEYNAELATHTGFGLNLTSEQLESYNELLNPAGDGMMGYITIDKIGVELPVYHGVEEPVLQRFVGHLPGTSLPVGGKNTHSLLSGHRGLPTSRLFTDLDQLAEGDVFLINVLNRTLAYEVDSTEVVEPTGVSGLYVEQGKDKVTLITCTPYGINTHRLLVHAHRVPYSPENRIAANAVPLDRWLVFSAVAVPAFAIMLIVFLVATRPKRAMVASAGSIAASNVAAASNGDGMIDSKEKR